MTKERIILVISLLLALSALILTACSDQSASANSDISNAPVKPTLVKAQLNNDLVSIPLSDVENNTNTRFLVNTATDRLSFMAYKYNNQIHIRADICPPCRSESFTLTKGTLVCDTCGTVFEAKNGNGVKGACVKFPKASVAYEVKDGKLIMKVKDLAFAYQDTLKPN